MTFSGLQVFTWPIDWADPVNGDWDFDLRELRIGFGAEIIDPLQEHIIYGWEFGAPFRATEIADIKTFLDLIQGRAQPFWLPGPETSFKIAAGVSTTQFNITAQDANDTWTQHPAKYVYFTKTGQTAQIGQISAVADIGGGLERVTLTSALGTAVDATWTAQPLFLVRNAEDEERVQLMAEGYERRTFRVVELPSDYTTLTPAKKPIYLYKVTLNVLGSATIWRYTSHPTNVTVSSALWTADKIEHGKIRYSVKDGGETEIICSGGRIDPVRWASILTSPSSQPFMGQIQIEILRTDTDLTTPVSLFVGWMERPTVNGLEVRARCQQWSEAMAQPIPAMFVQRDCNYRVYDPDTCRASKAAFEVAASIVSISGRVVTVSGAGLAGKAANWFGEGWLEFGSGVSKQVRFILQSTAASGTQLDVTLNTPLDQGGITVVTLVPGCSGLRNICISKFDNLDNFGGHETAVENLTLQAIKTPTTGMGKK